jgi:hypothetical protein
VKKLLTAFAFGALIAGVAGFVTSPALAADTGTSSGSTGAPDTGTAPKTKHKHHKSSHHHKKSTDSGTSSGTTGGTSGNMAPTTPSK